MGTVPSLTSAEAQRRAEAGQSNVSPRSSSKTVGQIFRSNLLTYFNAVHLFLFLCVCSVGAYKNGLFLAIIAVNAAIGIVQEWRAKTVVDRLSSLTAPHAVAMRDGKETKVKTEELVLGDTVKLSRGDRVPADARVVEGFLDVNESLVTGESDDVRRQPGDVLLSGSFVTSGTAYATLTEVGTSSYANRLTAQAKRIKSPRSELLRSMKTVLNIMGVVIIPVGLILFCHHISMPLDTASAVVKTVASLVGMIPSGLYLLTSIALTVGVITLGRSGALVQQTNAIEALARVDALCLDKTGTLTSGRMKLVKTLSLAETDVKNVMPSFLAAFDESTPTLDALREAFDGKKTQETAQVLPFSSSRRYSCVTFSDGSSFALGAPETLCPSAEMDAVVSAQKDGCRVLVFGRCDAFDEKGVRRFSPDELFCLCDQLRDHVCETTAFFQQNGVELFVITGDSAATASAVAKRAGVKGAENAVEMTDVADEDIFALVQTARVFGRVSPAQKKTLISALRKAGHTVAMTGDGVNDVLAMKEADCSVAMAAGCDMTCQIADLVLLQSDWTAMTDIVMEGRRVINNITRSSSLFFVKTVFSLVLSLLVLVLGTSYPFESIHMTLVSGLTVGIPGFLLALEPDRSRVGKGFLKPMFARSLPSALAVILGIVALLLCASGGLFDPVEIPTACTLFTLGVGFVTLALCCLPVSVWRVCVFVLCAVLAVVACLVLPGFFSLTALSLPAANAVRVGVCASVPVLAGLRLLFVRFADKLTK